MTASSKWPGAQSSVSASDTTGRISPAPVAAALSLTASTMSASLSTAHTSAEPAAQREGELAGAAGQVEQAPLPGYPGPAD